MITVPFTTSRTRRRPFWELDRLVMPRFTRDVDELRQQLPDIREILAANPIRGELTEDDRRFLRHVGPPGGAEEPVSASPATWDF